MPTFPVRQRNDKLSRRVGQSPASRLQLGVQTAIHLRAHTMPTMRRFSEHPKPKDRALMPTFPVRQRNDKLSRRVGQSPAAPNPLEARASEIASLFKNKR